MLRFLSLVPDLIWLLRRRWRCSTLRLLTVSIDPTTCPWGCHRTLRTLYGWVHHQRRCHIALRSVRRHRLDVVPQWWSSLTSPKEAA